MNTYLSHFSAAALWDIPNFDAIVPSKAADAPLPDVTVSDHAARRLANGRREHSCVVTLPAGAVVARKGVMVASPELLFLELANRLTMHRLILLGLQLCAYPPGRPGEAVSSKRKLALFLEKTSGHRGHRKAARALKYIEDGSASIMESLAYMVLTLPNALGGWGLSGAAFNQEILLNDAAAKRLGKKRCFVDLYYRKAKVAVEYQSFAHHSSPSAQGKDSVRAAILERQKIEVLLFSTIQLFDKAACRDFVFNLASRLGKRIQIRAANFDAAQTDLRALFDSVRIRQASLSDSTDSADSEDRE